MIYNRSISNPDAKDERLNIMGTDCWVIISYPKKHEIILLSKIDIAKMILDIEFDDIEEISQITYDICSRASAAIIEMYRDKSKK